jgi:predicted nucleotidyltransferase
LNALIDEALADFKRRNCRKSRSVFLVGSQALGEAQDDSDVDLIVVTHDDEAARGVRESLTELQSLLNEVPVD